MRERAAVEKILEELHDREQYEGGTSMADLFAQKSLKKREQAARQLFTRNCSDIYSAVSKPSTAGGAV